MADTITNAGELELPPECCGRCFYFQAASAGVSAQGLCLAEPPRIYVLPAPAKVLTNGGDAEQLSLQSRWPATAAFYRCRHFRPLTLDRMPWDMAERALLALDRLREGMATLARNHPPKTGGDG